MRIKLNAKAAKKKDHGHGDFVVDVNSSSLSEYFTLDIKGARFSFA